MKYSLKNLVLEMLDMYEFELYKVDDDSYALTDLQGANLGEIESDTFVTVFDLLDRMYAYHHDYIFRGIEDYADDFGVEKEYDSFTKLFENEKKFTQFFKSESPFSYELVLLIENPPTIKIKDMLRSDESE